MQRVRIGLTGLAFVFLAVLLAAVFTSEPDSEVPITAGRIEQQQRTGSPPVAETEPAQAGPTEPLAEIGVAPGKAESNLTAAETLPNSPVAPPR